MYSKLKFIYIAFALVLLASANISAQVALQGAEYLTDKIYINPAFAGMQGKLNASAYFQLYNTSVGGPGNSNTISAAADGTFGQYASSWGVDMLRNNFGSDGYTVAHLNYAYHLNLSSTTVMSTGVGLGFEQFGIDLLQLQTVSSNDPSAQSNVYSSKVDARIGIMVENDKKYYAGVSFDNLVSVYNSSSTSYNYSIPAIYRKVDMYLIGGANFNAGPEMTLRPSAVLMQTFGGMTTWEINGLLDITNRFTLGLSYRQNIYYAETAGEKSSTLSQFRPMVQFNIEKKHSLKVGYSYSFNSGNSLNINSGSNNLSLIYNIPDGSDRMGY